MNDSDATIKLDPSDLVSKVAIPTIHTNGSSAESLIGDYMNSYNDLTQAIKGMRNVVPNDRDYYVRGPEAGPEARRQHEEQVKKLMEVRKYLETIIIGIQDQEREKRRQTER